jgi:hypothetical protein
VWLRVSNSMGVEHPPAKAIVTRGWGPMNAEV